MQPQPDQPQQPPHQPPHPPPQPGYGPPPPPHAPPSAPYAPSAPCGPPVPPNPYAQPVPPHPYAQAPVPPGEGPEFLAVDRHNSVVADASGIAFEDHGTGIDFPWAEIRSVHVQASPSGKGLIVSVVHLDGVLYHCVVDARRRERMHEWFHRLRAVLAYYRPMG